MKLAVLSGKGGTGKTLVAVNLAAVVEKAQYLDCDVEEPNGHLFFKPESLQVEKVVIPIPKVDTRRCTGCRTCVELCNFNALAYIGEKLHIFGNICHACGGCILACPEKAVSQGERVIGCIERGSSQNVSVITGRLNIGEASGVPIIKKMIRGNRKEEAFTIIDCPPGSACIVMESIKDADYCILVAEPSIFGAHNLHMVAQLVQLFQKPFGVILNKCFDEENPSAQYCVEHKIEILGKIPFDEDLGMLNANGEIAVRENEAYRNMFLNFLHKAMREVKG